MKSCVSTFLFESLYRVVCAALFLVVSLTMSFAQNPIPQIVGPVEPDAVAPGSGEFTLSVYGANFVPGAVVNWNGQPRTTTFVSARELQAQILATDIATNTAGMISVTNPAPGGGNSSASWAQVEVHAPTATIAVTSPPFGIFIGGWSVAAADFTNNGILSLLGYENGGVGVALGNGQGEFQATNWISLQPYYSPGGVAYGDLNNDGILDFVFPTGDDVDLTPSQLVIELGNGDGTFNFKSRFGNFIGGWVQPVIADFNGDGKLDVALSDSFQSVNVYLGNGDGTFQSALTSKGQGPAVLAPLIVGDFNGDGKLDVLFERFRPPFNRFYLLLGNGDGTFEKPLEIGSVNGGCAFGSNLLVSDFNGDGKLDIAFCNQRQIGIMLGNGDGSFQKPTFYGAGNISNTFTFTAGDFNSDGKVDLLVSQAGLDINVVLLLGNGDGTFRVPQSVDLAGYGGEAGILPADFNADGLLDFGFMTASEGTTVVFVQQ